MKKPCSSIEIDKLREIVAPEFSVSVTTMPGALGYANQVLKNGKELDEISLLSVEEADERDFVVSVKFLVRILRLKHQKFFWVHSIK